MEISFFPQSYQYASAVQSDRPYSTESQSPPEDIQKIESSETESSEVDFRV